jgi:RNA-binding protein
VIGVPAGPLSGKARRQLRALGHHLRPVVQVGKDSVTDALVEAADRAIVDHELVKVKIGENADGDREQLARELAGRVRAELVGVVGRTALLYRPKPEAEKKKQLVKSPSAKKAPAKKKPAARAKKRAR